MKSTTLVHHLNVNPFIFNRLGVTNSIWARLDSRSVHIEKAAITQKAAGSIFEFGLIAI